MKTVHYESVIRFETGGVVVKTYRDDCECIRWLNRHLARYYDPAKGQPVAQHEFAALRFLEPCGFVPKPLRLDHGSIAMEYAGVPVSPRSEVSLDEYRRQCQSILATFAKLGFRHNDLLPGNVLVHHGRIKIIDFTLAEFDAVEIAGNLPDPDWARLGQDQALLTYAPRPGLMTKLARLLRYKSP